MADPCFTAYVYVYEYVLRHVVAALVSVDAYELAARIAAPWCGE